MFVFYFFIDIYPVLSFVMLIRSLCVFVNYCCRYFFPCVYIYIYYWFKPKQNNIYIYMCVYIYMYFYISLLCICSFIYFVIYVTVGLSLFR